MYSITHFFCVEEILLMWHCEIILSWLHIQVRQKNIPIKTTDFRIRSGFPEQGHSLAGDFGQFTHSINHLLHVAIKPLRIVEQNDSTIYKVRYLVCSTWYIMCVVVNNF